MNTTQPLAVTDLKEQLSKSCLGLRFRPGSVLASPCAALYPKSPVVSQPVRMVIRMLAIIQCRGRLCSIP